MIKAQLLQYIFLIKVRRLFGEEKVNLRGQYCSEQFLLKTNDSEKITTIII